MIFGRRIPPPLRIRCMQCDKPVKRIDLHHPAGAQAVITITVYCHGETDTMEVTPHMLKHQGAIEQIEAQEGQAFTTKKITPT